MKGWAYALAHKEATVDLILTEAIRQRRAAKPCCLRRSSTADIGRSRSQPDRRTGSRALADASLRPIGKLGLLTDDKVPEGLVWDGGMTAACGAG